VFISIENETVKWSGKMYRQLADLISLIRSEFLVTKGKNYGGVLARLSESLASSLFVFMH